MNAKLKTLFSGIVAVSFAVVLTLSCSAPNANNNYVPSVPGIDTPVDGLSSVQFASAMQSGWNLGNTFDSAEYGNKNNKLKASNGKSYETAWGMPETTEKMIYTVAAKGFKTIRIPISWHNHITDGDNYTIDPEWLARVKVVVDWARKNKMFVIINIHHDNLTSAQMSTTYGFSVNPDSSSEQETSKKYIKRIWEQVADYFKDYDNHVIFELLNEPRNMDLANPFNPSSSEESACNVVIKQYEQVALDAVRASGGNNANRFVMVPYYAASPWKYSNWSLPTDSASDKLLISTHAYDPYTFAMYDGSTDNTDFSESVEGAELKNLFDSLNTKWVSKGRGVVMGEGSCSDKGNTSDRLAWFKSYIAKAKAINCPLILWDNMATISTGATNASERHGYFNRNNCTWYFEELVNAMITTAGGTIDGNIPNGDGGEGGGNSGDTSTPVDLTKAVSGYGADISTANNILTIKTPASPAADYEGYSQVQIPFTKGSATKIAVTFKNNGKITMNFQVAGSDPWGSRILSDANAKYFNANSDYVTEEFAIENNAAFFTIGSSGVTDYEINVKSIVLK